jgi:hypothetical protein
MRFWRGKTPGNFDRPTPGALAIDRTDAATFGPQLIAASDWLNRRFLSF